MKIEKFTGSNNVLLVLGQRTDAHRGDCSMQEQCFTGLGSRGPVLIVETVEEVDYCSYLVYNFIYKCIYLVTDLLHNVRSSCVLLIDFC